MEPVSAAIGLFNHCLHAYRAFAHATELGSDSLKWDVLMRIELTRFVWGRTLGFLYERTGHEKVPKESGALLELAEILQIETPRRLVQDILESLKITLNEYKQAAEKYRLSPLQSQKKLRLNARRREFEALLKGAWASTKDLAVHLVLAITDKEKFKDFIITLRELNDGLDNVLSIAQKVQSAKALQSKVLAKYNTPVDLDIFDKEISADATGTLYSPQQHKSLANAARIKK
ncbi:prion-inhibition and propagation-domain-containing protein [Hypoxylon fuscum]|nr:prion-inhibition and propagation-domain-containing protein [Hypoxylon fuscum]